MELFLVFHSGVFVTAFDDEIKLELWLEENNKYFEVYKVNSEWTRYS